MTRSHLQLRCLVVAVTCVLAGCDAGPERPTLVPVTGDVVYKNEPVTAGSIIFYPAKDNEYTKDNPSSLLQLDGSFTMKTFPFGDGVAPGKYKVTLAPEVANRLKLPVYANPDTTPWEIDVPDSGLEDQKFEVKDAP